MHVCPSAVKLMMDNDGNRYDICFCALCFIIQVCTCLCGLGGIIQETDGAALKKGAPRSESHRHTVQQTVPQPV